MKRFISLLYVTFPDEESAEDIGRKLLAEKHIACINFFPIRSLYTWEGKIEDGKEQYIVRYAFETARYNQRNLISDAYKMTPQELEQAFKQEVLRAEKSREMDEKEAIENGYRIDQDYVDPDVWPFVK